jgi:hypothetical protein
VHRFDDFLNMIVDVRRDFRRDQFAFDQSVKHGLTFRGRGRLEFFDRAGEQVQLLTQSDVLELQVACGWRQIVRGYGSQRILAVVGRVGVRVAGVGGVVHAGEPFHHAAEQAVFGEHAKQLTVVSTKSMTGHLLGGAGGIEAVFTALALRDQFAPPTIHYEQPDPECDLDYVPNAGRAQTMTYALSNSLGFGGHNACIALRRWEG